ncbi:MAG: exosortase H [Sphingobacteriia bacterium]|nr:exosortase H [Sphingobacteriia bacterium]NCC40044.1 exosortase H [Gammaproteobacteria bacterium]
MLSFIAKFLGLLLVLSFIYNLPSVSAALIEPWNLILAQAAFGVMQLIDADVRLSGNVISTLAGANAVSVESDCNGVEATLLLLCAVVAFPASWKERLIGLAVGLFLVQGLNLVRIVSLFYLGQWNMAVFDWTHKYLWPIILIVVALLAFAWWIRSVVDATGGPPSNADATSDPGRPA